MATVFDFRRFVAPCDDLCRGCMSDTAGSLMRRNKGRQYTRTGRDMCDSKECESKRCHTRDAVTAARRTNPHALVLFFFVIHISRLDIDKMSWCEALKTISPMVTHYLVGDDNRCEKAKNKRLPPKLDRDAQATESGKTRANVIGWVKKEDSRLQFP